STPPPGPATPATAPPLPLPLPPPFPPGLPRAAAWADPPRAAVKDAPAAKKAGAESDAAPKVKTKAKAPAVVPFEMLATNHMVVRARINGQGPYRLIFDIGAPITLVSN